MLEKPLYMITDVNAYVRSKPVVVRIIMYDKEVSGLDTNTWIPAAPEYLVDEMAQWCEDNKCGKRTSYDMFEFPNEQAAMLFRLRWS
jgi:hypothetical protein